MLARLMVRSFYCLEPEAREVGENRPTILPPQFIKLAWIDHFKPLNLNSPAFGIEAACGDMPDILMLLFLPLERYNHEGGLHHKYVRI
jgi:hypothetical protein